MIARFHHPVHGAALAVLLLLAIASKAESCSCGQLPSPHEDFVNSAAVFVGIPRSVEVVGSPLPFLRHFTFEVVEVWKGQVPAIVHVYTGLSERDCGVPFELDVPWVVYADEAPADPLIPIQPPAFSTSICRHTGRISWEPIPTPALLHSWGRIKNSYR